MNRRISLSRIIAINWYGFRQIIDVEETILMSGVSGTGKSALLDLVQRVLLGENWRSNRAAAGAMRGRSEVSYVLCDTNTTRNGEPHYTNRSRASYIALEFTWPVEKGEPKRETWGWRIQYDSPTSDPRRVYFCIPERAGWESFSKAGELLGEDEFKTFIRREYDSSCLFSSQREYLAEMATPQHLYFNEEQLHKTMPKAIAFEPEENMEQFIREFILEESPIDVRDVRKSVIAYRETQERLLKQEDEAKFLGRVREFHSAYERERRTALLFTHLGAVLEEMRLRESLAELQTKLERLQASHASDNEAFAAQTAVAERLKTSLEQFTLDADEAELQAKRSEQHGKLREKALLHEAQQSVRDRLRTLARHWREWLQRGAEQHLEGLPEALNIEPAWLDALGAFDEAEGLQAIPLLAARFNDLFHRIRQLLEPLENDAKATEAKLRTLASEQDRLDHGQTPGDFPLFMAAGQALAKSPAVPEQLCRMIEVKPEAETDGWRRALELVLGRNRFAIVVESMDDYRTAMDLLRRQGRSDESVVHPREALELQAKPAPGSLAEKVTIASGSEQQRKIATSFVHHLIGRIIAAETMDEMDRAPERAVMRDGTYKQKPIRRKLTQPEKLDFTLGKEGLKRLRENLLREQKETTALRDAALAQVNAVKAWVDLGKREWALGDARLPDRSQELYRLPELEAQLATLKVRIEFLETPEREARIGALKEMREQLEAANIAIGKLNYAREGYTRQRHALDESIEGTGERLQAQELEAALSRGRLPADVHEDEVSAEAEALRAQYKAWDDRKHEAERRAERARAKANEARDHRNKERHAMIGAVNPDGRLRHPEYRHDYDPNDEDNERWDTRLRVLEEFELESFRKLAADRRLEWERRLREHVLNRLNDNIQTAERTVKDLRKYLDRQVRGHRYEISQRRDPAFTTLFSLLDPGFELTDELMASTHGAEVQQAMKELMAAVESADKNDERARRLLDYRYYHNYDLEMIRVGAPGGVKAQPISLGRSGRNLSGGENQAPFFISMLAAFRRVYDLGSSRSVHLGLVVMDEAFAKLSGDGVEDCLELAREFELQLLMAFPVDRLGVMAPFAQTIILCEKEEERDAAGYVTRVDNIPTRLSAQQAVESLV